MKSNYLDACKSKEWIIKRQIILKRDDNKCTVCQSKNNLRVHHTFYYSDYPEPYEYPNKSLITICEKCHTDWHLHNENVIRKRVITRLKRKKKIRKPKLKKKKIKRLSLAQIQSKIPKYRPRKNG